MSRKATVAWENFSKGEYGNLGGRQAGQMGPGWFHALNLMRYRNGFLGVRAGLLDLAPTGLANGVVNGFGWAGTSGADLWINQGTGFKLLDASATGNAVQAVAGTMASTPTRALQWVEGPSSRTYVANYGDKLYYLDHVADTLTAIAGSPAAGTLSFYGERLLAGGTSANPQRIYYSEAGNYTSFPAANIFDVGDGRGQIRFLAEQRGHLVIGKSDGTWWVLTGVPGVNDTLRRVAGGSVHPWHFYGNHAVQLGDGNIAFVPISASWPARFDGARVVEERHLEFLSNNEITDDSPEMVRACRGFKPEEYAFFGGNVSGGGSYAGQVLLNRHGVDTFHDFDLSTKAFAASDEQGRIFLTDGGAAGAAPKVYVWDLTLDRAAFANDSRARPTDGATVTHFDAYLHLPEWWDAQERELLVRSVTVDFVKWNNGASFTNHFDVYVDALDRYQLDGGNPSGVQSFDEAVGSASTSGTNDREVFYVGDQGKGTGFQIRITNVRGVAFRRIAATIEYEGSLAA